MNAAFRQLLEAGDVAALMKAWREVAPHLPQPKSRDEAEITMHMARTAAESIHLSLRHYSHRWLQERNLPSQLPGKHLPKVVEAVGISVNFRSRLLETAATQVRGAMEYAVHDRFAMGDTDPVVVRAAMDEAKDKTMRALFGRS